MGDGIVVGISPDWFRHQPYIWYQVLDGPYAGRYVYVAEQITRLAHVGTQLSAGQPLAYYKKSGTCLETDQTQASQTARPQTAASSSELTPAAERAINGWRSNPR